MALHPDSRAVLRSGGIVAATAFAGCSAIPFVGVPSSPTAANVLVRVQSQCDGVTARVQLDSKVPP